MERVDFVTAESGDDLIVAFAISRADPGEIRTLSLMRTPKYHALVFQVLRTTVGSKIVRNQIEQFRGTHSAFLGDGVEGTVWTRVNAMLLQNRYHVRDSHFIFGA